jgi:hypothetical protein
VEHNIHYTVTVRVDTCTGEQNTTGTIHVGESRLVT